VIERVAGGRRMPRNKPLANPRKKHDNILLYEPGVTFANIWFGQKVKQAFIREQ
jgi:hypothetical protein